MVKRALRQIPQGHRERKTKKTEKGLGKDMWTAGFKCIQLKNRGGKWFNKLAF